MYVNVAELFRSGISAPEPDILGMTDGSGLFYSGEYNLVFGDNECGKTWLALAAVADVLSAEGSSAFIDLDHNGAQSIVNRLCTFGVDPDVLADQDRFRLTEEDGIELGDVIENLAEFRPDVAVLDSLGEALQYYRLDANDGGDFTQAHTRIIKPLTRAGSGVVVIDHLAKNAGSREHGPTGSPAKLRAVGGAAILVKSDQPFKPGLGGSASLQLYKDRDGGIRRRVTGREAKPQIGKFTLGQEGDDLTYRIESSSAAAASQRAQRADEIADKIEELRKGNDFEVSVRSVKKHFRVGQGLAQEAITTLNRRTFKVA